MKERCASQEGSAILKVDVFKVMFLDVLSHLFFVFQISGTTTAVNPVKKTVKPVKTASFLVKQPRILLRGCRKKTVKIP